MNDLILPAGYEPKLGVREIEVAIKEIKEFFQTNLAFALNLIRVTAPLFVEAGTGINDDLNGIENAGRLPRSRSMDGVRAEIVQSLAKWKRLALARLRLRARRGPLHGHERHPARRDARQRPTRSTSTSGTGSG